MRLPSTRPGRTPRVGPSRGLALVLALAIGFAPALGFAQDDEEDDFLSDDYTGSDFEDDFLADDYVEQEQVEERDWTFWAFNVPVDILVTRPYAVTDTVIGGVFLAAAAPVLAIGGGASSAWDWAWGEGWYFDQGNLQAAKQICFDDPWAYTWSRPLGQLTSEF